MRPHTIIRDLLFAISYIDAQCRIGDVRRRTSAAEIWQAEGTISRKKKVG